MNPTEQIFGWFGAIAFFTFLCCLKSRTRRCFSECTDCFWDSLGRLPEFCISNVCEPVFSTCFSALTSKCVFCKRLRLWRNNSSTDNTDAESESSQNFVRVSDQLLELDENYTEIGDESPSVNAVPPPSYHSLVPNSSQAASDDVNPPANVAPPPSYHSLVSNTTEPSPSHHTESDDEIPFADVLPPPSYNSLVSNITEPSPSRQAESGDENPPADVVPPPSYNSLVSNTTEPTPNYTESGDENPSADVIPPPSYNSLVSNTCTTEPSPNYRTESGDENPSANAVPPPSYDSLESNSTEQLPSYEEVMR